MPSIVRTPPRRLIRPLELLDQLAFGELATVAGDRHDALTIDTFGHDALLEKRAPQRPGLRDAAPKAFPNLFAAGYRVQLARLGRQGRSHFLKWIGGT
jgi:hypothetical protein